MIFKNYNKYRVPIHILVWGLYFVTTSLPALTQGLGWSANGYFISHMLILMFATYVNNLFLTRKYLVNEQYKQYFLSLLLLVVFCDILIFLSGVVFIFPELEQKFVKQSIRAMMAFVFEFSLVAMFKAAKEWYLKAQRTKELEFKKIQAELNLLRSQLDSHFIFNTLNNLYLLVLNKSDKAPDAILKLSELLSYTIYESHEKRVQISKEVDFVRNYISLQELRLDESQNIYFNVDIGSEDYLIEPLILFNFIENAFKHAEGYVTVNDKSYYIYIRLVVTGNRLELLVLNAKDKAEERQMSRGVGLINANKRLALAYKDQYELDIKGDGEQYKVSLIINEL